MNSRDETPGVSANKERAAERFKQFTEEFMAEKAKFASGKDFVEWLLEAYKKNGETIEDMVAGMEELLDIATA